MGTGFLVLKIYREHPALLRWVYVPVCSPVQSQRAACRHGRGDTPGTMRSRGWNVEFGRWEDGGSVFKSTGAGEEWKWMHRLPSRQGANRKENSFKTSPQELTHPWGRQEHPPTIPPGWTEEQKWGFLQIRSSVLLLNKCHFQPMHPLACFRISTTNGTWYMPG